MLIEKFSFKNMSSILEQIRHLLKAHHNESPILFFKTNPGSYAEHDQFLGIKVPNLRKIAKKFSNLELKDNQILLQSKFNEERLLALIILVQQYQQAPPQQKNSIYQFYIKHISQVNNWNLVDASAHHIVGAHCYHHGYQPILNFAHSTSLWERRIAMVASFYFIKQKKLDLTFDIAKINLTDREDLIQKATGWMLRETGKIDCLQLKEFLDTYATLMPRTMLRYAIEKLEHKDRVYYLNKKDPA